MPLCERSIFLYKTSPCCQDIMFVIQLGILIFIRHSFLSHILCGVVLYMIMFMFLYMCYILYVYFIFSTGHHGRTVWLNGQPCINIFEIQNYWAVFGNFKRSSTTPMHILNVSLLTIAPLHGLQTRNPLSNNFIRPKFKVIWRNTRQFRVKLWISNINEKVIHRY